MTKVMEAISGLLGRTHVGREILGAGRAEEERLAERVAARKELDQADVDEARLPPLEADVVKAEQAYRDGMEELGLRLGAARRSYREAIGAIDRQRSRGLLALRQTPPAVIAENGPVVSVLQGAVEHLQSSHMSTDDERLREVVADFERAGKPKRDREVIEDVRARLERSDWAATCVTAVTEALELVREAQLVPGPDVPALLEELLEDVLVTTCTCGHDFKFAEAFDGPRLAIA